MVDVFFNHGLLSVVLVGLCFVVFVFDTDNEQEEDGDDCLVMMRWVVVVF